MKVFLVAPKIPDDLATSITMKWAKQFKASVGDLEHIEWVPLLAADALRATAEAVLTLDIDHNGVFIFIDHGDTDILLGSDEKPLLDFDNIHLLKNKFVYALACKSALALGPEAINKDVAGYIGFEENFQIAQKAPNLFFQCFMSGMVEMVKHKKNAMAAKKRVEKEIAKNIQLIKDHHTMDKKEKDFIITALRHNFHYMKIFGNQEWCIK